MTDDSEDGLEDLISDDEDSRILSKASPACLYFLNVQGAISPKEHLRRKHAEKVAALLDRPVVVNDPENDPDSEEFLNKFDKAPKGVYSPIAQEVVIDPKDLSNRKRKGSHGTVSEQGHSEDLSDQEGGEYDT